MWTFLSIQELEKGVNGRLEEGVWVLIVLGMEGGALLARANAEERAGTVLEVVAKILAPAHGDGEEGGSLQGQHLLGLGGMVLSGGEDVL